MRPSGECPCGACATHLCRSCALAYCASCCARRHAKGAFQRHILVATAAGGGAPPAPPQLNPSPQLRNDGEDGDNHSPACDECAASRAVLRCDACELCFCARCSEKVHSSGTMQDHVDFAALDGRKTASIRDSEATETPVGDVDHEPALPVAKSDGNDDANADVDAEASDLWSSWRARSFSERSSSLDSTSQWRSLRSLSIDSKASAGDDDLPLAQSLSQSLQSLAFSPPPPPPSDRPPVAFTQRPRSFSDYTSLQSHAALSDLWREPVSSTSASTSTSPSASSVLELAKALETAFPSRHVLIKSAGGAFDPTDVQRLTEQLTSFGSLVRLRDELAPDGLVFATYCELTSAITACRRWFPANTAAFCLPFEPPDDATSATLSVQLLGPVPASVTAMRQFCARFGDVASVLQNDVNASQYVVEFNDTRAVAGALQGLAAARHPHGTVVATRTSPPTLDVAKLQLVQDYVDNAAARAPSFSSSTTSMLTQSPTSSSSSPLNASFLEPPRDSSNSGLDAPVSVRSRAASPFDSSSFQLPDDPIIWSTGSAGRATLRPRSSSSSLIGLGAAVSSMYAPPEPTAFANPYSSAVAAGTAAAAASGTLPPYLSNRLPHHQQQPQPLQPSQLVHRTHGNPHFYHPQQRQMGPSGAKFAPARSGYVAAGSSTGSQPLSHGATGRNDQGVGEFCLAIDRVASGADKRTTLMVRNIPNKYTQQMLLAEINAHHRGRYDFFYLPIDFKNKCNMGYAFVNFIDAAAIVPFYQEFDAQKWTNFNSEKVCAISYARLQGKQAMIARFQNSSLLDKHESYRPLVFASAGANRGQPEPFPAPKQPLPHHQRKPFVHHPHHHVVLSGGGASGSGGDVAGMYAGAHTRLYMQQSQSPHQQMVMQQAMHHAQQLMAGQFAPTSGMHGMPPHLSYHHHPHPSHEQLVMGFPHHQPYHPHPAARHGSARAAAEFSL